MATLRKDKAPAWLEMRRQEICDLGFSSSPSDGYGPKGGKFCICDAENGILEAVSTVPGEKWHARLVLTYVKGSGPDAVAFLLEEDDGEKRCYQPSAAAGLDHREAFRLLKTAATSRDERHALLCRA